MISFCITLCEMTCYGEYLCCVVLAPECNLQSLFIHSGDETETDSEVEDRVDGVKSWLSKNKGSTKALSDEGSLKSTRLVLMYFNSRRSKTMYVSEVTHR